MKYGQDNNCNWFLTSLNSSNSALLSLSQENLYCTDFDSSAVILIIALMCLLEHMYSRPHPKISFFRQYFSLSSFLFFTISFGLMSRERIMEQSR